MTSYPRTYAQATAAGDHLNEHDWDAVVASYNGTTVTGVRAYPYDYLIRLNGDDYETVDSTHNVVFGGASDAGLVDGATFKAVLQATIDAARGTVNHTLTGTDARVDAHKVIFIQDDVTLAAGDIDLCDVDGLTLTGNGGNIHIQTNDATVFDCTNCYNLKVQNLNFIVDATYHPDIIWLFSRDNSEASTEFNNFTDCLFKDTDSAGVDNCMIYNHASETGNLTRCRFMHNKTAIKFTASNIDSITSTYKTIVTATHNYSTRGLTLSECAFTKTYWELYYPYYALYLEGCGEVTCYASYFGSGSDTGAVSGNFVFYVDLTTDSMYGLNLDSCKFEGKFITTGGNDTTLTAIVGVHTMNCYFHCFEADVNLPYFDLNKTNTRIIHWGMYNTIWHNPDTFLLDLPSTGNSVFDFSNGWGEPTVTFADFIQSVYSSFSNTSVTFTAFTSGTVTFTDTGGGTQSSGSGEGTGANQTIAHGLISTPTKIWLSRWGEYTLCNIAGSDATNITVKVYSGMGYNWKAEV